MLWAASQEGLAEVQYSPAGLSPVMLHECIADVDQAPEVTSSEHYYKQSTPSPLEQSSSPVLCLVAREVHYAAVQHHQARVAVGEDLHHQVA